MNMLVATFAAATLLLSGTQAKGNDGGPSQYDFIVVGGGTTGLAVANRLSEIKDFKVAIIEAGGSVLNNHNVSTVAGYGLAFGTEIDWAYETKNQTYAGGCSQTVRAGKAVGGTSTINGMSYTRAQSEQIDALEQFGNEGWNWETLAPYYKKSEKFEIPTSDQVSHGADYYLNYHGDSGPVKIGWPMKLTPGRVLPTLDKTFHKLNISYNRDVNGGNMVGLTSHPNTVDSQANVRQDAARSYYWPYEERPNLKLITDTRVNRIIWSNKPNETIAIGVEVTSLDRTYIIYASKEVILSAGSLRSPGLLELSGVGNPNLLNSLDIPVVVNLSSVGENLQDQTNNALAYAGTDEWYGSPTFSVLPSAKQLFGKEVSIFAAMVNVSLSGYAKNVSRISNGAVKEENLMEAFNFQLDLIYKYHAPFAEIVMLPIMNSFTSEYWTLLPFSRGNIHITSPDPSVAPEIDPRYFMFKPDLAAQVKVAKFIRKVFGTTPLKDLVGVEFAPGLRNLPNNATDVAWQSWIETRYRSNFHPVGTASMLPREKGGVVDSQLRVYGAKNVRVIDASILPFQLCGHLTSTLYAVAEKAADLIKKDYEG